MKAKSLNYERYEARHIKKMLGISKNKLFFWVRTHRLVEPAVEGSGTGTRNVFSKKNLLEIAFINELVNFGFDLRSIKRIKGLLDNSKILVEKAGDRLVRVDEDERSRASAVYKKYKYFDWAFIGSYPISFSIVKNKEDNEYYIRNLEWEPGDLKNEELLKYESILFVNISTMAKNIEEKIQKG